MKIKLIVLEKKPSFHVRQNLVLVPQYLTFSLFTFGICVEYFTLCIEMTRSLNFGPHSTNIKINQSQVGDGPMAEYSALTSLSRVRSVKASFSACASSFTHSTACMCGRFSFVCISLTGTK